MLWVKDPVWVSAPVSFPNTTTAVEPITELEGALERDQQRKEQKKIGESFHDHRFNIKLKSQAQWEKFSKELESTLAMIIGSQGLPISYVIRTDNGPNFNEDIPYNEAAMDAVPVTGPKFKVDARTVHQIILNNVQEDLDAYTYIKPLLRPKDGRRDIKALHNRYSSNTTKQAIINSAKDILENLQYKNERSFNFKRFSARF